MNQRSIELVQLLAKEKDEVAVSGLAEYFQVSQKTIRNDIREINDLLRENQKEEVVIAPGGKISLPKDFDASLPALTGGDFYTYRLSKEERTQAASAMIVNAAGFITLATIADNLFVSRATIINDLKGIKSYVKKRGLEVSSHANKGLRIEGPESVRRTFLLDVLRPSLGDKAGSSVVANFVSVQAGDQQIVRKILTEQERRHKCFLNDRSFLELTAFLRIMIGRNGIGEFLEPQSDQEEMTIDTAGWHDGEKTPEPDTAETKSAQNGEKSSKASVKSALMEPKPGSAKTEEAGKLQDARSAHYLFALDVLKYISQYCAVTTTENDARYLSRFLDGAGFIRGPVRGKDPVKVQMITRQFIAGISAELGVDLNTDYDFFENLANHIESVFSAPAREYPELDVVDEILEKDRNILEAVTNQMSVIYQYTDRRLNEDELKYVAIHACAAVERKRNREILFRVIVACHAGIGTSRLLIEKLRRHFHFRIVDVISAHEALRVDPTSADFVISTVPLDSCPIEHVVVSAAFNDTDFIRVGNRIDALRSSRNLPPALEEEGLSARGLIEKVRPVVYGAFPEERAEQEKAKALMKELRAVIRDYFKQSTEGEGEIISPYLHHLLTPDFIGLDVECSDWREAVLKSAEKLLERDYIEPKYIDAMIRSIETYGPYVVLARGFAMPHAKVEEGSIRMGMYLIRLKEPVDFGIEGMDPVRFICCLSAIDHRTYLKAFFNLVNLMNDEAFQEKLIAAKTPVEAAEIIARGEYSII